MKFIRMSIHILTPPSSDYAIRLLFNRTLSCLIVWILEVILGIHRFNTPIMIPVNIRVAEYGPVLKTVPIPISIVEHKQHQPKTPSLSLVGYGAYGVSYDVGFHSHWISLLDRGFRIAVAHVRGGGEMGRSWYNQGKGAHKQNSFDDFIACAEHLVNIQL